MTPKTTVYWTAAASLAAAVACHPTPRDHAANGERPASSATIELPHPTPLVPDDAGREAFARADSGPRCDVTILEVVRADVFTGVPPSPSRDASRARLEPKTAARWSARDHARAYLACTFRLSMNGTRYIYKHVGGTGFHADANLDRARCASEEMRSEAEGQVVKFTNQCVDPHAGAYWGSDLSPE